MGLKAKPTEGGGDRALPEEGLTPAICYQVLYLGHQEKTWNGKTSWKPVVRFTFELPELTHVFDEEKGPQPFVVSAEHTLFLSEKANLAKFLKQWYPKLNLSPDKEVDLAGLAGKPAMINVVHNEAKNGNTYANIGSIAPLMKGVEVPDAHNEILTYDVDEHDINAFNKLPKFIQDKIGASQEMQGQHGSDVDEATGGADAFEAMEEGAEEAF
jgi:hypothetical protein